MIENEVKKTSLALVIWKALSILFRLVFPSLVLMRIKKLVSTGDWTGNPWFRDEKRRLRILILLFLVPSLAALYLIKLEFSQIEIKADFLVEAYGGVLQDKNIKGAYHLLRENWTSLINGNEILSAFIRSLMYLAPSILISIYIQSQNEILRDTNRLQKILQGTGMWKSGQETKIAVCTPVGVIMDVTGRNPRDLLVDRSIWDALNIAIDDSDWKQNPEKMTIVMFHAKFKLPDTLVYN